MPMPKLPAAAALSRRHFLHALAAAGGVAAAASFRASAALGGLGGLTEAPVGRVRVGILPGGLGESWSNGLHLSLAGVPGVSVDLSPRTGGMLDAVKHLARQEMDVIVGALTPAVSRGVDAALNGSHAVFLNAEPGGHIQRAGDRRARVFHHTLQLWQANYAAGVWTAQNLGTRVATLCSFRDAGYDSVAAFAMGFESVGGQVVAKGVSHVPGRERSAARLVADLRAAQPDFIYVSASGKQARELLAAAGPGAVAAPQAHEASDGVETAFSSAYRRVNGLKPDSLALLGYEAGALILAAAREAHRSGGGFSDALGRAEFDGPRGHIGMNAETHTTTAAYVDGSGAPLRWLRPVAEREALAHPGWQQAVSGFSLAYGANPRVYRA